MAAKWRSFLTILGIIIGVASVIIIFAIGRSAQELILDQIRGVGSDLIGVLPGASKENEPPASALGISITTLKYDDLQAISNPKNVPELVEGAGYVMGTATISFEGEEKSRSFTGTTASYIKVENASISKGRFFIKSEDTNLSRVAVLGSKVAQEMFGINDPIGKKIKIKENNFTVIGILKERGSAAFGVSSQDDTIYVPLFTAQKLILGINHLGFMRLKVKNAQLIPAAIANIKSTLRIQHNISNPVNDDFSVRDQASALEIIGSVTDALRYFLLAIGSVALIVGGVGIMNVMLIAVNQRIREVGLRKAVGAKNVDVIFQFLVEAAAVSVLGGLIGIILGLLITLLISVVVQALGYKWPFLISPVSIFVAIAVSVLIGIIFGLYPARKASRISPMEALRYE